MKIIFRRYKRRTVPDPERNKLIPLVPYDKEIPAKDRFLIIRLDDGSEMEIAERTRGTLTIQGLNSHLGILPSHGKSLIRIAPFPYEE